MKKKPTEPKRRRTRVVGSASCKRLARHWEVSLCVSAAASSVGKSLRIMGAAAMGARRRLQIRRNRGRGLVRRLPEPAALLRAPRPGTYWCHELGHRRPLRGGPRDAAPGQGRGHGQGAVVPRAARGRAFSSRRGSTRTCTRSSAASTRRPRSRRAGGSAAATPTGRRAGRSWAACSI